jgi:hypothetical protein
MRIVRPILGSATAIEDHVALPDQALARVTQTAYRDIAGCTNADLPCAVGLRQRKNLSPLSEREPFARPLLERGHGDTEWPT